MAKKKLVVANWKLYVEKPEEVKKFATALRRKRLGTKATVAVAPSYPLIPLLAAALKGSTVKIGAQGVSQFEGGAHTGEVPATTLKGLGISYVIVGHSERRAAGESDEQITQQLMQVRVAKLTPILCVGERERDSGGAYLSFIENQLRAALGRSPTGEALAGAGKEPLVVAYEPVWAIGKTAADAMKPADAREMSIFIRKTLVEILSREAALRVPILYGGSVEPSDAPALVAEAEVDGFLVGHASADVDAFAAIINTCS